jgi:hypothetical protein
VRLPIEQESRTQGVEGGRTWINATLSEHYESGLGVMHHLWRAVGA